MAIQSKRADEVYAARLSLVLGLLLLAAKFAGHAATDLQSLFSDAMESIVNVMGAGAALWAVWFAAQPADEDHPYGHGKAEFFSAVFEGGLMAFASVVITIEAGKALVHGVSPRSVDLGTVIIFVCGMLNGVLGFYLRAVGKRRASAALVASGTHVLSDCLTSVGMTLGLLLLLATGWTWLDPLIALGVGVGLAYGAWKVLRGSVAGLLDEVDPGVLKNLARLFAKHQPTGFILFHATRVIRSGGFHHVDSHVVVPEFWPVERMHHETSSFEMRVLKEYALEGEIYFHGDPCRRAYCRHCDYPECPVRQEPFSGKRLELTLESFTATEEPEEFS